MNSGAGAEQGVFPWSCRNRQHIHRGEPAWLRALRVRSRSCLGSSQELKEDYLYTALGLGERRFHLLGGERSARLPFPKLPVSLACDRGQRILQVDGCIQEDVSRIQIDPGEPFVATLGHALDLRKPEMETALGRIAPPERGPFEALSLAYLQDAAVVFVPSCYHLQEPISLLSLAAGHTAPVCAQPRALVVLGAGARAMIVEEHLGESGAAYFSNSVTEIHLGEGATLEYCLFARTGVGAGLRLRLAFFLQGGSCGALGAAVLGAGASDLVVDVNFAKDHSRFERNVLALRGDHPGPGLCRRILREGSPVFEWENLLCPLGVHVESSRSGEQLRLDQERWRRGERGELGRELDSSTPPVSDDERVSQFTARFSHQELASRVVDALHQEMDLPPVPPL